MESARQRRVRLARVTAARAGRREARAAERLAAGRAGSPASGVSQVKLVVTDEADPIEAEARLAQRQLGRLD